MNLVGKLTHRILLMRSIFATSLASIAWTKRIALKKVAGTIFGFRADVMHGVHDLRHRGQTPRLREFENGA